MRRSLQALQNIISQEREQVYKTMVSDMDAASTLQTVWDQLDQRVTDRAVQEWRIRLRACVKAKGGYFEQIDRQWMTMLTFKCLRHFVVTVQTVKAVVFLHIGKFEWCLSLCVILFTISQCKVSRALRWGGKQNTVPIRSWQISAQFAEISWKLVY